MQANFSHIFVPKLNDYKPARLLHFVTFFLGKPWTYRLEIKRASNLPVFCEMAYVSYDFFGEAFTSGTFFLYLYLLCTLCNEW